MFNCYLPLYDTRLIGMTKYPENKIDVSVYSMP